MELGHSFRILFVIDSHQSTDARSLDDLRRMNFWFRSSGWMAVARIPTAE
jgi:hypothetical protein